MDVPQEPPETVGRARQTVGRAGRIVATGFRETATFARAPADVVPLKARLEGVEAPPRHGLRRITIGRDWRIRSVTAAAAQWCGANPADLEGEDIRTRWPLSAQALRAIQDTLSSGCPSHIKFESSVIPGRWVEFRTSRDGDSVHLDLQDITDGSIRTATAPATPPPEVVVLDGEGVIVTANAAWRAALAARELDDAEYGPGAHYLEICRKLVPHVDMARLKKDLAALLSGQSREFKANYTIGPAAQIRHRQVQILPLATEGDPRFVAIHEDLTQRARVEQDLRETSRQLLSAQERERKRIAGELHDTVSQQLTVLHLALGRLRRELASDSAAKPLLDEMSNSVNEAFKETRAVSHVLFPPDLEQDGLVAATERFVEGFGRRTGLDVEFRADGPVDHCEAGVRHAIFRMVQEAMSNVYRHARATRAEIELVHRDGLVTARIADNGKGIGGNPMDGEALLGVGISGMRARIEQFRGRLEISHGPDGGTVVTAAIPMDAQS